MAAYLRCQVVTNRVEKVKEDSTEIEDEEDSQEEEQFNDKRSEEKKFEEEAFEKKKLFEPIIETQDELLPEDPTNLDIINTYFTHINIPDLDGNYSKSDLTNPLLSTTPSHFLNNNLTALSF